MYYYSHNNDKQQKNIKQHNKNGRCHYSNGNERLNGFCVFHDNRFVQNSRDWLLCLKRPVRQNLYKCQIPNNFLAIFFTVKFDSKLVIKSSLKIAHTRNVLLPYLVKYGTTFDTRWPWMF